MPKITRHGGPSIAGALVVGGAWSDSDAPDGFHDPEDVQDEVSEQPPAEPAYEDWTVEQLKEQLAERGLPKGGKRDDLVQRLREDDAAPTQGE
ncbi:SAP domain-containing protein [Streptomyces sp. NPDC059718]